MTQQVNNLPAVQDTQDMQFPFLGWEDPLEEEMATHSSAWKIPWTEEPGGLQSMRSQRVGQDSATLSMHAGFWGAWGRMKTDC